MDFLPEAIESYALAHSDEEPELLQRLHRETWQKVVMPRMLSGHFQGRLLGLFSKLIQPESILEVGAYTGYSTICLCEGLRPTGRMHTIELNDELNSLQDKYWCEAGLIDRIKRYNGKALDLLPEIDGPFDLVFIDADKTNYAAYYELALPKLRAGGLMLIDNVLWSGKVVESIDKPDADTEALQQLNALIKNDDRVGKLLLPFRDGITAVMKK